MAFLVPPIISRQEGIPITWDWATCEKIPGVRRGLCEVWMTVVRKNICCYSSSRLSQQSFSWIWSAWMSPAGKLALWFVILFYTHLKPPGSLALINLAGELTESGLWIQCGRHLWGFTGQPMGLFLFLPLWPQNCVPTTELPCANCFCCVGSI